MALLSARLYSFIPVVLTTSLMVLSGCMTSSPIGADARAADLQKPVPAGAWESVDCSEFDVPLLVGALSDCGYVTVPQHHARPGGPTLQLAVVRTRSIGDHPVPDPLLLGQGGPGDSAIGVFVNQGLQALPQLLALLENRDLVAIDQRGTQYSRPFLGCTEKFEHNLAVARGDRDPGDTAWMAACRDRLLTRDVDFSAYNTVENAADFYAVAEVLGYNEFNYYGGSYGSLLGQYILAQADEHAAQLRSVVIDGVVMPSVDFNLAAGYTISHSLRQVFSSCHRDEECNRAYPNLETVFLNLYDDLEQNPVPITLTVPDSENTIETLLDSEGLIDAVIPYLYSTAGSPSFPKVMYQAKARDFSWAEQQLSGGLAETASQGMYNAVLCARAASVVVNPADLFPAAYPGLVSIGERDSEEVIRFCDLISVEPEEAFDYDNIEIPTLILSGSYDPVTPEIYAAGIVSELDTAYAYTFPAVGHVVLGSPPDRAASGCFTDIVVAFLTDPHSAPDSNCLAAVTPEFELDEE